MALCSKCGSELPEVGNFCIECGEKFRDEVEVQKVNEVNNNAVSSEVVSTTTADNIDEKNSSFLCAVSLILMYLGFPVVLVIANFFPSSFNSFFALLGLISPLVAFVLMVIARIKYPKSTFAKILMIVYLIQLALVLFLIISLAYLCNYCSRGLGMVLFR